MARVCQRTEILGIMREFRSEKFSFARRCLAWLGAAKVDSNLNDRPARKLCRATEGKIRRHFRWIDALKNIFHQTECWGNTATRFTEKKFPGVSTPGSLHGEFTVVAECKGEGREGGKEKMDTSPPYGSLFFVLAADVPFPASFCLNDYVV